MFIPKREDLVDSKGRYFTQGLFLEIGYGTDFSMYTLKDHDFTYKGKLYPSLKRLYLEMEDAVEYEFANTYLASWDHWQRICNNKLFKERIESWRFELELKLRSRAVKTIQEHAAGEKGFQAAKWLADRGWNKQGAGRPTKEKLEGEIALARRASADFDADITRLNRID